MGDMADWSIDNGLMPDDDSQERSMETITAHFKFERTTKGAHMYKECDPNGDPIKSLYDCKIGQIYVRKTVMPVAVDCLVVAVSEVTYDAF